MKLFNKQAIALLVSVITINVLCVISVSYAFFTATVDGTGSVMTIKSGTMELTFKDSDAVTLNNFVPGDSVSKEFSVTSTGSLATYYSIKLNITNNTFADKADLLITLKKNGTAVYTDKPLPTTIGESYIYVNQSIGKSPASDKYELIIKFKKDTSDQSDNKSGNLAMKVVVDNNQKAVSVIK